MTPQLEEAQRFLRLAAQDEILLDKLLSDREVPNSIWGFHAQQAVEKLLKAVLTAKNKPFPRTHLRAPQPGRFG